jgi:hypothetical protein
VARSIRATEIEVSGGSPTSFTFTNATPSAIATNLGVGNMLVAGMVTLQSSAPVDASSAWRTVEYEPIPSTLTLRT